MITRRTKNSLKSISVLVFLAIVCIYFFLNHFFLKIDKGSLITPEVKIETKKKLDKAVKSALEGTKGNYAVVIKSLENKDSYFLNEHEIFDAGSLYKLWVMAETFKQIQANTLTENEVLTEEIETLNNKFDIDPDLAELKDGTISLSVLDALNQMITISHNYAALLLTEKIKLSTVDNFLAKNSFKESSVGVGGESPKTSASDIALFLEKLYKQSLVYDEKQVNEFASGENARKMLELLKKQQLNDKLPKDLPEGVIVAHKTGEIDYFSHDGGIVFSPKEDYIIVVLSKSDMPQAAEDRIAQISKNVYEYFNN